MTGLYQNYGPSPTAPARNAYAAVLSDTADQAKPCKAFRASRAGTVRVTPIDADDGSFIDHPVLEGEVVSLMVKRFWSTGSTAGMAIVGYAD